MNCVIDHMTANDWEQVRSIYLEGVRSGNSTFETEAPSWELWNESHLPFARLVMRDGNKILGWAALSPVSKRSAYRGVAELTVYVTESARHQGIGRALLQGVIDEVGAKWYLDTSGVDLSGECCKRKVALAVRISGSRQA